MKPVLRTPLGVVAALVLGFGVGLPARLPAGEAIKFSNARNRQDPTVKSKLPTSSGAAVSRVSIPSDYVPYEDRRRDPERDRKARNAADEKANWMVLDPGQLDAEDRGKRGFGVREVTLEKEQERRDYFFSAKEDEKSGASGSLRPTLARDRSTSGELKESMPETTKEGVGTDSRNAPVVGQDGRPLGEHTAKELDLKDLLSPGKANSLVPPPEKISEMWRDVFGGEAQPEPARRRDERTTADSFRGSLSSLGAAKSSDAFGARSDFTTRPAPASAPTLSAPSPAPRSIAPPAAPVAPRLADPTASRFSGFNASPPTTDPYNSRNGNGAFGPDRNPAADRTATQQRRSSWGSQQIPSRPGYGGR